MQIKNILTVDRTLAKIDGASKKRVIETIAKTFAESSNFEVNDLYQNLLNREKLGTTGIGHGIAIPHCRFNTGGETFGACLTLEQPIDFDSVDGAPVDIIFAMLVPENAESAHLEALSALAELLQQASFVKKLRSANDAQTLFETAISTP